jgi:hypothetical protein
MKNSDAELIFVYNAESGFFNTIKDALHKVISPSTYQCNLCALTYGTMTVKDEWKTFVEKLVIKTEFVHRDEFLRMLETHPHKIKDINFPAVFVRKKERITLFVKHNEINKCKTLNDLMNLITQKIRSL